ncbi:cyclic nucleotide-gated cation channel subunit a [Holotrichia oblita]|uniref:Cyclic nucleotide-gated cation channel subunit a n=1 Tax=Holotrichia oblita TaxID=644536 RepID=A0ACB9SYF1_HOLOL|nr:cyclic nucleotide-gated cation channel subunit a [Holotrichia oblita]
MIENCFKKVGFQKNNGCSTSFEWDTEDYLPLSMIVQMERCANEVNVTQENLENYIRIDDIAITEEMSLNIEDAIEDIIEHDPAPEEEEEEDSDLGCDTVGSSSTITRYNKAFKIINDLKTFANDDYIAFQHLKNLDHFQSNFLKQKILNMRQQSILEFVNT